MVIDVKAFKNSIEIKCNPIIPLKFKYIFLKKLKSIYNLKTNDDCFIEDVDAFIECEKNNRATIKKEEYLNFYLENRFSFSFEDFLDLTTFSVGTLIISNQISKTIAVVDFVPDGEVNSIWIDICSSEHAENLLQLINESICSYNDDDITI